MVPWFSHPDKAIRHWDAGGIALSIETSAYALLTQVLMGRVKYAGPIVRWLTTQRNAAGGFSSTQVRASLFL